MSVDPVIVEMSGHARNFIETALGINKPEDLYTIAKDVFLDDVVGDSEKKTLTFLFSYNSFFKAYSGFAETIQKAYEENLTEIQNIFPNGVQFRKQILTV